MTLKWSAEYRALRQIQNTIGNGLELNAASHKQLSERDETVDIIAGWRQNHTRRRGREVNGFSNTQIIGGLITMQVATYAAFFAWVVRRFDRLEERFDVKIDRLDIKIDKLDEKIGSEFRTVYAKLDSLTIAVSRLEGAAYHAPPERRTAGEA